MLPEVAGGAARPHGSARSGPRHQRGHDGAEGLTLLHRAVRSGSAAMVERLLSFGCARASAGGCAHTPLALTVVSARLQGSGMCACGQAGRALQLTLAHARYGRQPWLQV